MQTKPLRLLAIALLMGVILFGNRPEASAAEPAPRPPGQTGLAIQPVFRYPVVPDAVVSMYFDHNPAAGRVTFYDGRQNSNPAYGFYFSCSTPYMYDYVGCMDNVSGEAACPNHRELWYDGHHGLDYEFAPNWHTGAVCNPGRFAGITRPIYAPAAGKVMFAGEDPGRPANGWHIRIKHDLNRNGNYEDDGFRSNYLHFTAYALAVQANEIVQEGQYLGLGGSTGYSSSPHLHFEVQRSSDNFFRTIWSVDPNGWSGPGNDPWPYPNHYLWKFDTPFHHYLPGIMNEVSATGCPGCGELLRNRGFEEGQVAWVVEQGVDVISPASHPNLTTSPYSGGWLGWLGGRNSAVDVLSQVFDVPAGSSGGRLRYYIQVQTQEAEQIAYDRLYVRLRTPEGALVQEVDEINNTFSPPNQWVLRERSLPILAARQGQDLRLSFEAITDANLKTNFYLDEVSLVANE